MNDVAARSYAVEALVGCAAELDAHAGNVAAVDVGRARPLHDLAARMRGAAERLELEREPGNPVDALRRAIWTARADIAALREHLLALELKVDAIGTRVLGGPPRGGLVPLDGDELDRGQAG